MMRCMLHAADLGPQYWSFALVHAAKLYNPLPHSSINQTPLQAFTKVKPDICNIKIFGSRVYAKKPGNREFKLDNHSYQGIYLGSTSNEKNVYILDSKTNRIKIGAHVYFDECHMTTPAGKAPLAAEALQRLGYNQSETWVKEHQDLKAQHEYALVQKLSPQAQLPRRGTKHSVGYDVINPNNEVVIEPGATTVIPTDLAITPPPNSYMRIAPRSGLTIKNHLTTLAGVIDPDYTGNIGIVVHNFGKVSQTIQPKQKIAQIIFENAMCPRMKSVDNINKTSRGSAGFGSTDIHSEIKTSIATANTSTTSDLSLSFDLPYHIELSSDPFDFKTSRRISTKTAHPTLGLSTTLCPIYKRIKLDSCQPSTPSARIPKWRSELRNAYILAVNNESVSTLPQLKSAIKTCKQQNLKEVEIRFATNDCIATHPQLGVPQLYHDQLDVIAAHLWELNQNKPKPKWTAIQLQNIIMNNSTHKRLPKHLIKKCSMMIKIATSNKTPKKLTRRWLQQQLDWDDWKKSEHKQLNQYQEQGTFGPPQPYPKGANLLNLLWTYLIKDDGTKKSRCVCNSSPKMSGTVTMGETYAAALEQCASRIFWAVAALWNLIVIGADASNAFAEAPPPIAPLYVTIDKPYREWWQSKGNPPITKDYVLQVKGALQGHPESPRLWAVLIDRIIKQLDLKPCQHEPCLYYTNNYKQTGKTVLFLRQVDDFAVACQDSKLAQEIISEINSKMTINVKQLGIISRFNGVDVEQTQQYIKIKNETYIDKIISQHPWLQQSNPSHTYPIPMQTDATYRSALEQAQPATTSELQQLEKEYGFKYRQGIGEILYAMVTCRPDISFPVVKLSQYSVGPSRIHFEAVKKLYLYLKATKSEGIHYWRTKLRPDLPSGIQPNVHPDNHLHSDIKNTPPSKSSRLFSASDSDHASDSTHRKSISGIIHMLAGGAIHYKTKYQDIVAQSTSEAEFIAAAETGKQILYNRSILDAIGLPQEQATTLYQDNQGALMMANAQKPTKRSKHMDIRHFALQDWVNCDLLTLRRITTAENYSDCMTKPLPRNLLYRHLDYIQGRIVPEYAQSANKWKSNISYDERELMPQVKQLIFKLHSKQCLGSLLPLSRTGEGVVTNVG